MEPSTSWQERADPGEAERFESYARQIAALQAKIARDGKPARALHAKANLGLEATFEVHGDLPEYARQGLFAQPTTFRAYVRFSNGAARRQPDKKPDVRGMAVKLVGVGGEKLIPGMERALTQDFLLIRASSQPFRNADEFVPFVLAAENPVTLPFKMIARFGFARTFSLLKELTSGLGMPMPPLAMTSYYSALPIQFGPYAARFAFIPRESAVAAPRPKPLGPDYLAEELGQHLEQAPVMYDFKAQFFVDEARTPIEDASVEWSEADAPYVTLGHLTLLAQDIHSTRGQKIAAFVERLSFDPWHAQEELRPLGNMMRARNAAYRESTRTRGAAPEPDGTESFDEPDAAVG